MQSRKLCFVVFCAVFAVLICYTSAADDQKEEEVVEADPEKLEYARGSLCRYCDYCKFCELCDKDCPCESSPSQPNCKMCKYCKFCYLCKVCDAVCQPGGFIDTVSAAIVNGVLPAHDPEAIEKDLDSVKPWLDKKDEL